MKLAIAQMVLGVIIVSDFVMTLYAVAIYIVLGLSVLGCGVAQYLKAREARNKYKATP